MKLQEEVLKLWNKKKYNEHDSQVFDNFKKALNNGEIRSAECIDGEWRTNDWVNSTIKTPIPCRIFLRKKIYVLFLVVHLFAMELISAGML